MTYDQAVLAQLCSPWGRADLAKTAKVLAQQAERAMEMVAFGRQDGGINLFCRASGRTIALPPPVMPEFAAHKG